MCTWLGVGNDPRYTNTTTNTTTFETFPFRAGLTPADTAHQCTEPEGGARIPTDLPIAAPFIAASASIAPATAANPKNFKLNQPLALIPPALAAINSIAPRAAATAIAQAAHRLTTLRDAWLNPPEWTVRVPEVVPLGMSTTPYPGDDTA